MRYAAFSRVRAGICVVLTPCVLVAKPRLPAELRSGIAPHVCIILDQYRNLEWQHSDGDATASLAGEFVAFEVDGERYGCHEGLRAGGRAGY